MSFALNYLVDHELDLRALDAQFKNDEVGASAYDPRVMLKIVLLAYSQGLISSRVIEQACQRNVQFIAISGDSQRYREGHTLITADAGYHSDANIKHLKDHNIPALIADNQMRSRDERFAEQAKYKGKPDPLSEKAETGQPKEVKRFQPKEFRFNDDNSATCPAGSRACHCGLDPLLSGDIFK